MTNGLPGSQHSAGYVARRHSQGDQFRLLFAPPRDSDVLIADEVVYYRGPRHAASLIEPAVETAAVLLLVVAILTRPTISGLNLATLLLLLSAITVWRWIKNREWGWASLVSGVITMYVVVTSDLDPLILVPCVGLFFLARLGLRILRWWRYEIRYLTNRRIIEATGFLGLRVASLPVTRVTDLVLNRTTGGELLGYGSLRIESAGQDQSLANIPFLVQPKAFHRLAVRLATKPSTIEVNEFIDVRPSGSIERS